MPQTDNAASEVVILSVDQFDALMAKLDKLDLDMENLTEKVDNLNLSTGDGFSEDTF